MTAVAEVARVRIPAGGLRQDLRAVKIVWQRDLIRFWRDKPRMVAGLLQPILFLFVLGTGLSRLAPEADGVDLRTFMFPGAVAMSVLFTSMFSAGSIVWDRELGFLREMLVAPIRRGSIALGKCLGGATVGTFQGVIVLGLAGVVGVPYNPVLMLTLVAELFLLAFAMTAIGVLIASRVQTIPAFMAIMQMLVMPLFFLSGALYPLAGLPTWLQTITRLNPLTYAVDPMRHAVFKYLDIPDAARATLDSGVHWWGWRVPTLVELSVVFALAALMLTLSVLAFRKAE